MSLRSIRHMLALAVAAICFASASLLVSVSVIAAPAPPSDLWTLIGKDTNDPTVSYYTSCGAGTRPLPGFGGENYANIMCKSLGFELDITPKVNAQAVFVVYQVVLYSNRQTGFAQYRGNLPWGLTWAYTYQDVLNRLGQPSNVSGGFGTDITLVYRSTAGYEVDIELVARHTSDLRANTTMHDIKVWRPKR